MISASFFARDIDHVTHHPESNNAVILYGPGGSSLTLLDFPNHIATAIVEHYSGSVKDVVIRDGHGVAYRVMPDGSKRLAHLP